MRRTWLALLAAGLFSLPAAADAPKIDRALKKEPAYKGQPRYLLLAFGDKAEHRAWLVHDGDTLYVDRNGDGDLTGQGEAVAKLVDKNRPAEENAWSFDVGELRLGGRTHKGLSVGIVPLKQWADVPTIRAFKPFADALKAAPDGHLARIMLDVDHPRLKGGGLGGRVSIMAGPVDAAGVLQFAASAKAAPVLRPDGPLQVTLEGPDLPKLTLGRGNDLMLVVGARGHGPGTLAMVVYQDTIPDKAHPKVEVKWPGAREGDEPVKEIYELKDRC